MNLIIDIGNTRTKVAHFQDEKLIDKVVFDTIDKNKIEKFIEKKEIQNVILTNSGALPEEVESFLKNNFFYIHLDKDTPIPIKNMYETPETLGKDRLAGAVAGASIYPRRNVLTIDVGTCVTYNYVSKRSHFIGGNISPGINMRLKAMNAFTAKLPLLSRGEVKDWMGKNTESAMQNGAIVGTIMEIYAFIKDAKKRYPDICVLLTGGDSEFVASNLKTMVFVELNLVLIGLNQILNYNVKIKN